MNRASAKPCTACWRAGAGGVRSFAQNSARRALFALTTRWPARPRHGAAHPVGRRRLGLGCAAVDWHGNEVPLHHEGELLRLQAGGGADTGEWWVLDYKSAAQPERQPELIEQMRRYREAVQGAGRRAVRSAFLTAQGRLVPA